MKALPNPGVNITLRGPGASAAAAYLGALKSETGRKATDPALEPEAVRGVRVVTQGFNDYGRSQIVRGTDPRGYPYYWFGLGAVPQTPRHDTDLEAIADGFVTVTPLHLDLTHYDSMATLGRVFPSEGGGPDSLS